MLLTAKFEKYLTNKKGVIHVGGHTAEERDWYKEQGFSSVLWFEPCRKSYLTLVDNIQGYSNQHAFNMGIHNTLTKAPLHIASNDAESSSLLELGTHAQEYPNIVYEKDEIVNLIRLDDFFQNYKIRIEEYNFLNADVQGTELNVVKSLGLLIKKFDYVYLEVNEAELYKGCALLPEVDYYLREYGFVRVKTYMTGSKWGDAFYKRYY